eukprot:5676526-Pyramimonas_sp.AAC.1
MAQLSGLALRRTAGQVPTAFGRDQCLRARQGARLVRSSRDTSACSEFEALGGNKRAARGRRGCEVHALSASDSEQCLG